MADKPWSLVADIGGTNARFGLQDRESRCLREVCSYSVAEYRNFGDALSRFLSHISTQGLWQASPRAACFAVASVVEGDLIRFTNSPWRICRAEVSALLGNIDVELINDFAAVGYGITELSSADWRQIGGADALAHRPIAVLGPGTGLGVCSLIPVSQEDGRGYSVVEGEGGHVDFAPVDEDEIAVLKILSKKFGRVSVERLLSGDGLINIYNALAQLVGGAAAPLKASDITRAAVTGAANSECGIDERNDGKDDKNAELARGQKIVAQDAMIQKALAQKSLNMFCRILGSVAGNLALTLGARGGVYIAGGIVPRIIDYVEASDFRQRFEAKGRFRSYLAEIPVRIVVKDNLGLHGVIKKLNLAES